MDLKMGEQASEVDHKVRDKLREVAGKWGGGQAFKTDKPKKVIWLLGHIYSPKSSVLLLSRSNFSCLLICCQKSGGSCPLDICSYVPWYRSMIMFWKRFYEYCKKSFKIPKGNQKPLIEGGQKKKDKIYTKHHTEN